MCGIVGIVRRDGRAVDATDREALLRMAAPIGYRGPDGWKMVELGPALLGFNRLAVVDVTNGEQPFRNGSATLTLVANGEIYNHAALRAALPAVTRWRSGSDCEPLVHLYHERGGAFLDDVVGMFALAIWDDRRRELVLARDRFGIKPLYYCEAGRALLFASEIKALLRHPAAPREFDWDAALGDLWLSGDAAAQPLPAPTYYRGIEAVPPATILTFSAGTVPRAQRYWSLGPPGAPGAGTPRHAQEFVQAYRSLLGDAVAKCLMADVPVALALSGGVDSAAVAALAAPHAPLATFSVASPSTWESGDAMAALRVAQALGLPNHQVLIGGSSGGLDPGTWMRLVELCETPYCGAEQLYKAQLYRAVKDVAPEVKVVLSGQGSDEFNGGYSVLLAPEEAPHWDGFADSLALMRRGYLRRRAPSAIALWEDLLDAELFADRYLERFAGPVAEPWEAYLRTKLRDLEVYNLWQEDRCSAGSSIENRVPFLDHRLVELVWSVPAELRSRLLWNKAILREGLRADLPAWAWARPKVPFFFGRGERHTHRMMANLLRADGFALVEHGWAAGSAAAEVVRRDDLIAAIERAADADDAPALIGLGRIVNMGLLAAAATAAGWADDVALGLPVPLSLSDPDEDELREVLAAEEELTLDSVVVLAEGLSLARELGSGARWHVVGDGVLVASLDEGEAAWGAVLTSLAEPAALREVTGELTWDELAPRVRAALDAGILRTLVAAER